MILDCYKSIHSQVIVKTAITFSYFSKNPLAFPNKCLCIKVPAIMNPPLASITWKHVPITVY